jgi:hypothetical protein
MNLKNCTVGAYVVVLCSKIQPDKRKSKRGKKAKKNQDAAYSEEKEEAKEEKYIWVGLITEVLPYGKFKAKPYKPSGNPFLKACLKANWVEQEEAEAEDVDYRTVICYFKKWTQSAKLPSDVKTSIERRNIFSSKKISKKQRRQD